MARLIQHRSPLAASRSALPRTPTDTLRWSVAAYSLLLVALIWGYALHIASDDRQLVQTQAEERLLGTSTAIAAETQAMMGDGVGAALAAANEIKSRQNFDSAPDAALQSTLRNMLTGGPYVRALFIADAIRFERVGRGAGRDSLAAPPTWLAPALAVGAAPVWVGVPLHDPDAPAGYVVPVARRVGDLWVGALFSFDGLEAAYLPRDSVVRIGLISEAGIMLEQLPLRLYGAWIGHDLSGTVAFRTAIATGQHSGLLHTVGPMIGRMALISYAYVPGYPLIATSSETDADLLSGWSTRRANTLLLATTFTVVVGGTALLLLHLLGRLARREHHYQTLFNNAVFGAMILENARIVTANNTCAGMFGAADALALTGLEPWQLSTAKQFDERDSEPSLRDHIFAALRHGTHSFVWRCRRTDTGADFLLATDFSSLEAEGRSLTLAVMHDVTDKFRFDSEREALVSELQHLASALMRLQDDERRRIGRDLHDSTGQVLVALELQLADLQAHHVGSDFAAQTLLTDCVALARRCSSEIRTASYLLHPPLLDEIGLLSAIRWLADGLQQRSGICIELQLPDDLGRLAPELELALFRVTQEALANVHRHAMSPSVTIRLIRSATSLTLEIEDAGVGLPPPRSGHSDSTTLSPTATVGLAGMRERLRELGGTLLIESTSPGTRVRGIVPLQITLQRGVDTGSYVLHSA